ncbi:hypothetical protein SBI_08207 [Streptomyces bingchenggensis BCW-1]|uniref:Uncharacterized protein n=1 Tax=Streptomyces bingchenggensis (strain BCW-1) TaxID=749414 RepID=D7CIE7_STRBB|nr:hypothetical protein SBI_08207 [Streptomyces bingchenggensis BCW-1]
MGDDPLGAFFRTARVTVTVHNEEQPAGYINGRPLTTLDRGRIIVPLGRAVMVFCAGERRITDEALAFGRMGA